MKQNPKMAGVIRFQGKDFFVNLIDNCIVRIDCEHERYDIDHIVTELTGEAYNQLEKLQLEYLKKPGSENKIY